MTQKFASKNLKGLGNEYSILVRYMNKCLHNQRDKRKFHIQAMNWIVILQGGEALNHIPF